MNASPESLSHDKFSRLTGIDGLRGLAALAVLFYHARGMIWIGTSETYLSYGLGPDFSVWIGYLSIPLSLGGLGVTLFFVLSGYCIHRRGARILATHPNTTFGIRTYLSRRFWRIYPTYIGALILTALLDWWCIKQTGVIDPIQDDSLFSFVVSVIALQGFIARHFGSNGVFWTLAMEIHLYLAYPLLYFASKKFGPRFSLSVSLAAGILYFLIDHFVGIESRLPFRFQEGPIFLPYWFSWTAGFYLAEIEFNRAKNFSVAQWASLMAIGLFVGLAMTLNGLSTMANTPWAIFFAGLLWFSISQKGETLWSKWPGKFLAGVGVFSYSLYAIHAPLLNTLHALIAPADLQKFQTIWPALAGALCVIPFAWVFYRFVEYWSVRKTPKKSPVKL